MLEWAVPRRLACAALLLLLGCSRRGGPFDPDPGPAEDLGSADGGDDLAAADGGGPDGRGAAPDLRGVDLSGRDLAVPADLSAPADLAFNGDAAVDIYVDNFCKMDVVP